MAPKIRIAAESQRVLGAPDSERGIKEFSPFFLLGQTVFYVEILFVIKQCFGK